MAGVAFVGLLVKESGHTQTTGYVTYKHMEELLKKHGMQYQTMIDKIKTMKHPKLMRANKQQIKFLQSRKVLHKKATVAILISLESARKLLKAAGDAHTSV